MYPSLRLTRCLLRLQSGLDANIGATTNMQRRSPDHDESSAELFPTGLARTPTFLGLPAELRNRIYSYLFESSDSVCIAFHRDTGSRSSKLALSFRSETPFPLSLFLACRQINAEASSVFYSNNTFLLRVRGNSRIWVCFIDALLVFLDRVGTRACLIRNFAVDNINFCTRICHREYLDWNKELFDQDSCIVEVTSLLRMVWSRGLRVQRLKDYGSLVCGVAVRYDGSGGMISWGSSPPPGIYNAAWPRYYPHTTTPFTNTITGTGDTELKLVPRFTPTLLSLPKSIRSYIRDLVVFPPGESTEINVDIMTAFPLGLPHVNKQLYASLWPASLLAHRSYVLRTCTTNTRSDFNGFSNLRRLLNKAITYTPPHGTPVVVTLKHGYPGIEKIILEFNLKIGVEFNDLRISILPLVRETRGIFSRYKEVIVRICYGNDVRERRVSLEKLRGEVLGALESVSVSEGDTEQHVWINGLGELIEVVAEPVAGG
ncbi:conserved hypothetical protein [Pyrenophora tritici-repentis Pt-1C-BFP]|uniref:F-box domain-containing protein n=1 Tax=Pyrenophora tritici-repentis (strain Pt-1C-BFP) TaxID=426418 RepID=B2W542_PYRTR|nr:uncharacterized protein PTRG_04742 [Pyrenophora tritici-repentis Pt-1C-BFP]EDU47649.1 conserved hypothetical protein [Pyrenophora tritici-repentis Pt-1C-BFP]